MYWSEIIMLERNDRFQMYFEICNAKMYQIGMQRLNADIIANSEPCH